MHAHKKQKIIIGIKLTGKYIKNHNNLGRFIKQIYNNHIIQMNILLLINKSAIKCLSLEVARSRERVGFQLCAHFQGYTIYS